MIASASSLTPESKTWETLPAAPERGSPAQVTGNPRTYQELAQFWLRSARPKHTLNRTNETVVE